jgi:hypothetical protein
MVILAAVPEVLPVDLIALVGVSLSMLLLIIPVLGWTVRLAARPIIDALLHYQTTLLALRGPTGGAAQADLERLGRRVLELEQELAKLKQAVVPEGLQPVTPVSALPEGAEQAPMARPASAVAMAKWTPPMP